jgi:NAD(P)-dependent dehydrogenase (short-subunit alcohol dehydrogenase family)
MVGRRLAHEVAVITGSTSGLGRVTATQFAAEGAAVVVTGRNAQRGEAVVEEIARLGGEAVFVRADLGVESECRSLVSSAARRFGRLTVLVNNAVDPEAISDDRQVTDLSYATLDRLVKINLIGPVMMCKFAIPEMMKAGHGSIVNVSATSGAMGTPGLTGYSVTKGGMAALSRSITADYGRVGIRCNTLQAGYIIHRGREPTMSEERLAELRSRHLTRLANPEDVANAIMFLASRESEVITGIILPVDGGVSTVRGRTL